MTLDVKKAIGVGVWLASVPGEINNQAFIRLNASIKTVQVKSI